MFSVVSQYITIIMVFVILIIVMIGIGLKFKKTDPLKVNSNFQNLCEMLFSTFHNLVEDVLGKKGAETFTPLAMTIFLSIFLTNIAGLVTLKEGAFLNPLYTFTWSISMFFLWNIYGIYKCGIKKYLKDIATPWPLIPIEIIGILTKPISLGARLFGNITAGAVIMLAFWQLPVLLINMVSTAHIFQSTLLIVVQPFLILIGSMLSIYFSVFGPFVQALIFTMLTLSNISMLIEE